MMNALLTQKPVNSYTELDQITNRIHQEHQRCIHSPKTALIHACNAGVGLIEVRSKLSPQRWQYWLTTHCQLRPDTAHIYMEMASKCSHFPQNLPLYLTAKSQKKSILPSPPQNPPKNQTVGNADKKSENSFQTVVFPDPVNEADHSHQKASQPAETPALPELVKSTQSVVKQAPDASLPPSPEAVIDVDFVQTPPSSLSPSSSPSPNSKTGIIRFCLAGGVVPKARPRVTGNGTYLPQRYRAWRNQAEVELYRQMCELHPTPQFPLQKAAISLRFFGNHRTNSDIDNLAGACLDALTLNGAGILKDDRLSCLPQLTVEFVPGTPETGVWIEIEPLV